MPHPKSRGSSRVRTTNEPRYKQFVRWIADDLSPRLEDYEYRSTRQATEETAQRRRAPAAATPTT